MSLNLMDKKFHRNNMYIQRKTALQIFRLIKLKSFNFFSDFEDNRIFTLPFLFPSRFMRSNVQVIVYHFGSSFYWVLRTINSLSLKAFIIVFISTVNLTMSQFHSIALLVSILLL